MRTYVIKAKEIEITDKFGGPTIRWMQPCTEPARTKLMMIRIDQKQDAAYPVGCKTSLDLNEGVTTVGNDKVWGEAAQQ